MNDLYDKAATIIETANNIVIVQADNPDGDSIGTALALESILSEQGKKVALYCGVDIPGYLKYLTGWSRVLPELPKQFDASIIVDASAKTLLERATLSGEINWLATKPCIVFDHHVETANDIDFASVVINDHDASSTSELVYDFAQKCGYTVPEDAFDPLMTGILGDTQGLTNQLTNARTYQVMSDLTAAGANRPALEELRRSFGKMPESIYRYKGELINRTEFNDEHTIATVSLNQQEINKYSPLYNPGPLIQTDMLQVEGVHVGIVFKVYDDGKITAMIRCNPKAEIANKIAVKFGGGGHGFAAGYKIVDGRPFAQIKAETIAYATELLNNLPQE